MQRHFMLYIKLNLEIIKWVTQTFSFLFVNFKYMLKTFNLSNKDTIATHTYLALQNIFHTSTLREIS